MAGTREMKHPVLEVEDHAEGLLIRFRVTGSTLGPVEVVLSYDEAAELCGALDMALAFSGAGDDV